MIVSVVENVLADAADAGGRRGGVRHGRHLRAALHAALRRAHTTPCGHKVVPIRKYCFLIAIIAQQ